MSEHVRIVMVEDDEGHARLIENNIRRAGCHQRNHPFQERHRGGRIPVWPRWLGQGQQRPCAADPARSQPARYERCRHPKRVKENEHLKLTPVVVLTTTDDERRDQALLRSRRQRLHHQARELREFCQRHSSAWLVLLGHPGPGNRPERHAKERPYTLTTIPGCAGWLNAASAPRAFASLRWKMDWLRVERLAVRRNSMSSRSTITCRGSMVSAHCSAFKRCPIILRSSS